MKNQAFLSESNFKQAFNQGLVNLLTTNTSAGTFILALANFIQHHDLYESNRALIEQSYLQLLQLYNEYHEKGVDPEDSKDDIAVSNSIFSLGLNNVQLSRSRVISGINNQWIVSYNELRSFRPERMSNQTTDSIDIKFNESGFHFDKAFLNKEIFIEQEFDKRLISLLYNKFPFADYHGLLVIDRAEHYQQLLFEEIFEYIVNFYKTLSNKIPGLVFSYNSIGAGASVNHLHFQTCITDKEFTICSKNWAHNGGGDSYPAKCDVSTNSKHAWIRINKLQKNNVPFNLIFISNKIYCLPRSLNVSGDPAIKQVAWFEMAGCFSMPDNKQYLALTNEQIESALKDNSAL